MEKNSRILERYYWRLHYNKNEGNVQGGQKKCSYTFNAHIAQSIQAIAMKKQPNQRPFNSLSNDVWFPGHLRHRNGQNGHLKKST